MRINDSLSLNALRQLSRSNQAIARSLGRLASGSRINQSQDDAAGLAIASGLDAQVRGIKRGIQNMNEAQGYLATADGALAEQTNIVQRLRELALQSANGTLGANDRSALNTEFQKLLEELDRIGTQTNFNGTKLLDGSFATQSIQIGARKGEALDLNLTSSRLTNLIKSEVTSGTGTFRNTLESSGTATEVTQIGVNSIADYLDAKYFLIDDPNLGSFAVYFSLDGADSDPSVDGRTGVSVNVNSGDNQQDVANTLAQTLSGIGFFVSTVGSTIKITASGAGAISDTQDISTGFSISTLTQGKGTSLALNVGSNLLAPSSAADINSDGFMDLIQADNNSNRIIVFLNDGSGSFTRAQTLSLSASPYNRTILKDVNADGNTDLIQNTTNGVSVFLNNGFGSFSLNQTLSVGSGPVASPVLVDVNSDGKLDLIQSSTGSNTVSIFLNDGAGNFTKSQTLSGLFNPDSSPVLVDINSDGKLDLIQASGSSTSLYVFLNNGSGSFVQSQTLTVGIGRTYSPTVSDINGDGKPDLLEDNLFTGDISVFLNNGSGGFVQAQTLTVGSFPVGSPLLLDINSDGRPDLLQTNSDDGNISVFLNQGGGSFTQSQTLLVGTSPSSGAVLADLNADGFVDLLQANQGSNNISIFLNNGSGGFTKAQTLSSGYSPISAPLVIDINSDGILDIVQSNYASSNISLLIQNTTSELQPVLGAALAIDTQEHSQNMLDALDHALSSLSTNRANIGALQSRLNFASNVASVTGENLAQARSQVLDTDYANETADLVRSQILQQAGVAVLGQANLQSRAILQLLNF